MVSCVCLSHKICCSSHGIPQFSFNILCVFPPHCHSLVKVTVFWRLAAPLWPNLVLWHRSTVRFFNFFFPSPAIQQILVPVCSLWKKVWMPRLWFFFFVWMSKDTSCYEFKTEGGDEEGWRLLWKNRVVFSRGPEEWLGYICFIPLAKGRKHMVTWQPSVFHQRWKIFHQRWKVVGRKKSVIYWILTGINILTVAFVCSITTNEADRLWVSLALLQLREEMVCIMSFWISCCRICVSLLGQSHSTAYMLWYSRECCLPSTVLEIRFG